MGKYFFIILILFQFSNAGWFDKDEYLHAIVDKNKIQGLLNRANKEGKFIIVEAFSSKCAYCRAMDDKVFSDKEVRKILRENYIFIKVDVTYGLDSLPNGLIKKFEGSVPSFFILFPDGEYEETYSGSMSKDEFLELLDIYKI